MAQKAPSVIVTFKERGITAIQRSQRGILAMILNQTAGSADHLLC